MTLAIGARAPRLVGPTADGTSFDSDAHRGRPLVVYFYPRDFTAGCTKQACLFRDAHAEVVGLGATLVGVSRDPPERHAAFKAEHRIPFPLVSDVDGAIAKAFGATPLGGLLNLTRRVTYVIDGAGVVRGAFHHELDMGAHVDDVRGCLARLAQEQARAAAP